MAQISRTMSPTAISGLSQTPQMTSASSSRDPRTQRNHVGAVDRVLCLSGQKTLPSWQPLSIWEEPAELPLRQEQNQTHRGNPNDRCEPNLLLR